MLTMSILPRHEGRFAIVTERRVRDAVGAAGRSMMSHADERCRGAGEIVGSWSPDAEAKRAVTSRS